MLSLSLAVNVCLYLREPFGIRTKSQQSITPLGIITTTADDTVVFSLAFVVLGPSVALA